MKHTIFALALGAASALGMSQKPKITVRFHAETNPNDGSTFNRPVQLQYMQRKATLSNMPILSEREIKSIYPFPTADGTFGCTFILTPQGKMRLEQLTTEQRGTALVVFLGTKAGAHQVVDMMIDRVITDGIISIPRGMTDLEAAALSKQFPVLGAEKKKPEKKKKEEVPDWSLKREQGEPPPALPPPTRTAKPLPKPPSRNELRDLNLPRIAD